ncbi:hypothetical protein Csp2054_00650 [Curtobacterium sp. 'Ferrero']|nr:hypothetical protein Csp2054_00650 [Curtobacterium sp. 'Ferrero']
MLAGRGRVGWWSVTEVVRRGTGAGSPASWWFVTATPAESWTGSVQAWPTTVSMVTSPEARS